MNPPALHFHHVNVKFGDTGVLEDISFDMEAGQSLAIIELAKIEKYL
jgi:ABC-type transporter Mla maintaining outer membrane lipid asymmetry ATPase subunit MlaF|tara:strand:+ start:730 stop:870 length:141 start_codon:yes stop_codon:yes gene_type:complete